MFPNSTSFMRKGTEVKLYAFYMTTLDAGYLHAVAALTQSYIPVLLGQDLDSD
jgi:hypothetical protein